MKKVFLKFIELCTRFYLWRNRHIKLVIVAGSIGKTSTKNAVYTVLREKFRVRESYGNQNSTYSVPFGITGITWPGHKAIRNPLGALKIIFKFKLAALRRDDTEIIVQELGTDSPGDIPLFGKYLKADFAILTGITPEHMETFKTLDAVAKEELSVKDFSDHLIINTENTQKKYLKDLEFVPYTSEDIDAPKLIGKHSLIPVRGAVTIGRLLGMSKDEISRGVKNIKPTSGRMRLFDGVNDTKLIDDTYNSSPEAVLAALETLYEIDTPQRIAVLGQMNEMGDHSEKMHTEIGKALDGKKLDILITNGGDANEFLAPNAKGVKQIFTASSPYEAGELVKKHAKKGAAILFKGSQNGVFLEEAVKIMLKNPEDKKHLVRQAGHWRRKKREMFPKK